MDVKFITLHAEEIKAVALGLKAVIQIQEFAATSKNDAGTKALRTNVQVQNLLSVTRSLADQLSSMQNGF